ncbi:hypothetical protein R0914_25035, partial [Escherichia coli]
NDVTLKMPAFEWVHVQLHQQKGMISLSPPTICNSALPRDCKAVRSVAEAEDHGAYRYRRTMDNNFRLVNVYITDMKITEIPQK